MSSDGVRRLGGQVGEAGRIDEDGPVMERIY